MITTVADQKLSILAIDVQGIPQALKDRRQWVLWKLEPDEKGKPTKEPYQVNGRLADVSDPQTWNTFEAVLLRYNRGAYDGVGYVFSKDDPFVGIDLDGCRNPENGYIAPWAWGWISRFASYCEVSPTGTGFKVWCVGKNPKGTGGNTRIVENLITEQKEPGVEIYDRGRYFAVTGQRYEGAPATIETTDPEVLELFVRHYFGRSSNGAGNGKANGAGGREASERCWRYIQKMPDAISGSGGHNATFAAACECFRFGLETADAHEIMRRFNAMKSGDEQWTEKELVHKLEGARQRVMADGEFGCRLIEDWSGNGSADRADGPSVRSKVLTAPSAACPAADVDGDHDVITDPWPDPLDCQALHGLGGEIVAAIEPHTEADPVAILAQFMVTFGNIIGRTAHFCAEADRHYCNLFIAIVGRTAKGRKGTSWGQTRRVAEAVDPAWAEKRIMGGLSSGEGLIWQCRDPLCKREAIREGGRATGRVVDYQDVEFDKGVTDKRLLILESEFAGVLKVAARERNTLSAILRQAWDTGTLRTLTKNSPATATDAHISIIGHITRDELKQTICETDMANGLANRFLWLCVRRSKCLPEGGNIESVNFAPLIHAVHEAVEFAQRVGEIRRDDQAREVWAEIYPDLSEGKPGLLGAATSRAEAQVMRLAMIYALLDRSTVIRREHLVAGLALWSYAEQSARYIFGSAMGNPEADEILRALRAAGEAGMTRTEIRKLFGGHQSKESISAALSELIDAKRVRQAKEASGGRPTERWFAVS